MSLATPYHLHALHGFLGAPDDWQRFGFDSHVSTYNLFSHFPIVDFSEWSSLFNRHVFESTKPGKHILLGYSLGGRLGLHAVLQNPSLWTAAVFISTHTGLDSDTEKQARLTEDTLWAERFRKESWSSLMDSWNAQEVFQGDVSSLERTEKYYDRTILAKALSIWSLGRQKKLSDAIQDLNIPILWMVGENDLKFVHRAQKMSFKHPKSQICLMPNASHRLVWQQPREFITYLTQFMHNLE